LILLGLAPVLPAVDCEVPTFLVQGKPYEIAAGMGGGHSTILEIDKQACWIKVESAIKSEFSGKEFSNYDLVELEADHND
jgi:hypothetical protein